MLTLEQNRRRWKLYKNGIKQTTPAAPVTRRLRRLINEFNMTHSQIARLADVPVTTVKTHYQGRSATINTGTAVKLMAVTPVPGSESYTSPIGYRRRAHSLVAAGFPLSFLAARMYQESSRPDAAFSSSMRSGVVRYRNHQKMVALFGELQMKQPQDFPEILPATINRALGQAKRNGWPLPLMWDEDALDAPDGFPDWTGFCGTAEGRGYHRRDRLERPCEPCRLAYNRYEIARIARRRSEALAAGAAVM